MNRVLSYTLLALSALAAALAVGFFLQMPWATGLWPWPTSRLSNLFIAAMLAASAGALVWVAFSEEMAAIRGGAIDLGVTYGGMAAFSFAVYAAQPERSGTLAYAMVCSALAALALALLWTTRASDFRDMRPTPGFVRLSFAVFVIGLVLAGGGLVLRVGNIFPWPLSAEQSALYGWMFLGSACYFLYGVINPRWANAKGQLIAFLAYDVVLIVPFVKHFGTVRPDLKINLILYTIVLTYSGLLAVYYLFVNGETRLFTSPSLTPTGSRT
jgi:hypothetical protein